MDIAGKRVVVTGASSGIGLAFARRLALAGAKVVGVSRTPEEIEKELGPLGVHSIGCDVSDPAQVDEMIARAEEILGGIDVFAANAGFAYFGPIGPADWQKNEMIYKTNVLSPIYTLQKLSYGRKEPLSFMVTISALGKMVLPGFALYDSTKFALDGFVRTFRMEKQKNIKIIPVYPVATYTKFFRRAGGEDTPKPFPVQPAGLVAWCMEMGLRTGFSVYTSIIFLVRCLLVRVLPVDLLPQGIGLIRFARWRKRHNV